MRKSIMRSFRKAAHPNGCRRLCTTRRVYICSKANVALQRLLCEEASLEP
ncbi:hypothetical protein OIDMADRAFT_178660 [Oidiodendron maius Zn]|uniref:Uncharacterized protein n=1 Tax=Oidiodendron maius (strain Zn) TaxID=913774 RepID=A0A0C3DLA8_OIDMZ|nr:hypothetical protein OIDMADRAFT_178660 [Oidiodendron maius Zn]